MVKTRFSAPLPKYFLLKRLFQLAIFLRLLDINYTYTIPDFDFATTTLSPKQTGFLLSGVAGGDFFGASVRSAGDINKDGYADIIVGAWKWSSSKGAAYVFFGGPTNGFADIDLSTTSLNPGSTGFAILGAVAGDQLGYSVSTAGDMNGDTYDDIVIGANSKGGNQGVAYVIYGKQTWTGNIDLSNTVLDPATTGFMVVGDAVGDQLGFSVDVAGDMNRDGFSDIVLGAPQKTFGRGAAYVVYGGSSLGHRYLSTPLIPSSTGFTITGAGTGNNLGSSVSLAGDVNGDGYKDIVIGAVGVNSNQGRIYVIYNTATPGNIDFSIGTVLDPSTTGFAVSGEAGSFFGFAVSTAGDVNKDGKDDVLVGAYGANSGAGAAYVIYGKTVPASLDISSSALNPASTGFKVWGSASGGHLGSAVSAAGDLNGDSYADILVGADFWNNMMGAAYVIYGSASPSNVVLSSTNLNPATTGFTIKGGSPTTNNLGYGVGVADVNNDGIQDLLVGAYRKSSERGAVYVIHTACMTANCVSCTSKVCTSCDAVNSWFLSGTTCTQSCPIKTFPSTTTGVCEACLTNCNVCTSSTTCTTCTPPNLLYNSISCGPTCPAKTYDNSNGVCAACPANCDTCTSGTVCNVCSATYFLDQALSSCTQNCPVKFYGRTSTKKCEACPANCDTCTSGTVCTVCSATYFLDQALSSCTQNCPVKFYGSTSTKKCEACPANCDTCTSGTVCTVCSATYFLDQPLSSCTQNCPVKFYGSTSTKKCEACPTNCDTCTSGTVCTVCSSTYFLDQALSSCTQNCPVKFYGSTSTKKCEACSANCDTCTSGTVCTVCSATYFLDQALSSCTQNCPVKFYGSTSTKKCEACPSNCDTCTSGTVCTVCSLTYFLDQALSSCTQNCPVKFYGRTSTKKCEVCPANCDTCTSGTVCTVCSLTYFLDQALSSCTQNCPVKFYGSTSTKKCEACSSNCNTCTSGSVCTVCSATYFLDQSLFSCTQNCPVKFYGLTSTGKCEACPANCNTCTSGTVCTICSSTYFLNQALSSCTQNCPTTFYGSTSSGKCETCPSDCDVCTDPNTCTTCTSPYFLDQSLSSCGQTCPTRFFGSTTTGKCEDCSADCLTCTSGTSCQVCDQKYALVNAACEACPDNCDACTSSTSCYDCTSPYLLYQIWCLTACPNGTFAETTTGKCQSCPKHCAICTSLDACQTCDQDYVPANASTCVIPPTPTYPKTENAATKAITSSVTAAGSLVCVGSVTFPQAAIVSKIVQNMRYINLTVTDDLLEVYQTWSTNLIDWDFPNFIISLDDFKEAPTTFSQYSLGSPFLANFWSTLMTLGVSIGTLIGCFLLKIFFERTQFHGGWIHRILQKLVLGSFNFALVQVYTCMDDILFYLVLDTKGNPFNSAYDWGSIICASLFMAAGSYMLYFNFQTVRNYQMIKAEGKAKKDHSALEAFNERNKYWELFYADFNDTDMWSQSTLALIVMRSTSSSFIIAVLYSCPFIQTTLLIILDVAMVLFLISKNPFTTLRGKLAQYYFETVTLTVHLVGFILSFQRPYGEFSETILNILCTSIVYLNMCLMIGSVGFMFIELYKTISQKVKVKRLKKYETIAIQTGFDESYEAQVTNSPDSSAILTHISTQFGGAMKQKKMNWRENRQVVPFGNSYELSAFTEENNNISFTGMNLLHSNTSHFNLNTDDSIDKSEEIIHQRGQNRIPMAAVFEGDEEIPHSRGQIGIPVGARKKRRNIKKKEPTDLITL